MSHVPAVINESQWEVMANNCKPFGYNIVSVESYVKGYYYFHLPLFVVSWELEGVALSLYEYCMSTDIAASVYNIANQYVITLAKHIRWNSDNWL